MQDVSESLLRAILSTVSRQTFPPADLMRIVSGAGGRRQLIAYNLCDGKTPQAEIARRAKLDKGNFSRVVTRWLSAGIIFRVGVDNHLLHLYPLSDAGSKDS